MDKYTIQQDLNTILKEEIPDDMNILPEIHKQLKKQSGTGIRPMLTLSRVAAVIAIFLLVTVGGYALLQRNLVTKSIPQQIITDINETQTIEDVDVTLNWAYADAHRITIAYSMEYPQMDNFINAPTVILTTADGIVIPQAFGGGGGGGGGGAPDRPIMSESLLNFDSSGIQTGDAVDLVLKLDFSAEAIRNNPSMAYLSGGGGGGGSASGGGGGGGGSSSGGGGSDPVPTPDVSAILDRIFSFEFTLPFYQALTAEPIDDTVESNDITITVSNLRYTPSLTKFDMCYNSPDESMWNAQIQLSTNSPDSPFYSSRIIPIDQTLDDGRPCHEMDVAAAILDGASEIVINVLYLSQPIWPPTDEIVESEEAYFAELGYEIDIDASGTGFSIDILQYPADTTAIKADEYVHANLFKKRYDGDWQFVFPLQ